MVTAAAPTASDPAPLPTRADLGAGERRVIHPGSATKAAVRVIEWEAGSLLVKDVRPLHGLLRTLYGRRVLRREERALTALAGTAGVPRLLGRIDEDALAMQFLDAEPLRRNLGPERLRKACIALGPRVAALHERGVVHLDLRQKRNILVDREGEVFLVDFQSALVLAHDGWRGLLFRLLAPFDRGAVLKFRARYVPDLLSEAERTRARRSRLLGRLWIFHRFGPLLRWLFGRSRTRSP
jgi:hypothetical protein